MSKYNLGNNFYACERFAVTRDLSGFVLPVDPTVFDRLMRRFWISLVALLAFPAVALAGPPYISDDPEPTDDGHFEIYAFSNGTLTRDGVAGGTGIDFNYGGAKDLQLTAVVPLAYGDPAHGKSEQGLGNVELAAKYKFLHQEEDGWDVAVFPRLFLPSASSQVGDHHASLFLPLFLGKDWEEWSTFGGGGCVLNQSRDSKNFCIGGWVLVRNLTEQLHIGAELVHQTADYKGGKDSTSVGAGVVYDLNDHYHLMGYAGPGLENAALTNRYSWYAALLFTF